MAATAAAGVVACDEHNGQLVIGTQVQAVKDTLAERVPSL